MAPIVYGDLINILITKERCAMPWCVMYWKAVQDPLTRCTLQRGSARSTHDKGAPEIDPSGFQGALLCKLDLEVGN